jgi:hypothetical protein
MCLLILHCLFIFKKGELSWSRCCSESACVMCASVCGCAYPLVWTWEDPYHPPYMRQGLSVVHFRVCRRAEDSGECPEATMRLTIEVLGLPVRAALSGLTWVLGMQTRTLKLSWHVCYQLNHLSKRNWLLLRAWMLPLLQRRKIGFGNKPLPWAVVGEAQPMLLARMALLRSLHCGSLWLSSTVLVYLEGGGEQAIWIPACCHCQTSESSLTVRARVMGGNEAEE